MGFKFKEETVRKVDFTAVESFLERYYGIEEVSLLADNEWDNGASYPLYVEASNLEDYEIEECQRFLEGDKTYQPDSHVLLNYAAKIGDVEEGEYLVEVYY